MTDRHLLTIVVEVHADPVTDDPQEVADRILDDGTGLDGEPHRPDMIAATWSPPVLPLPGTIAYDDARQRPGQPVQAIHPGVLLPTIPATAVVTNRHGDEVVLTGAAVGMAADIDPPADVPTTTTAWAAGPPLTVNRPED